MIIIYGWLERLLIIIVFIEENVCGVDLACTYMHDVALARFSQQSAVLLSPLSVPVDSCASIPCASMLCFDCALRGVDDLFGDS